MDRNSLIGFILIGVILLIYLVYYSPEQPKKKDKKPSEEQERVEETSPTSEDTTPSKTPETTPQETAENQEEEPTQQDSLSLPAPFGQFTQGKDRALTLENEILKLRISRKGGNIQYAEVKKHKRYDGSPLVLIDSNTTRFSYQFFYEDRRVNTGDLYFETPDESRKVTGDDSVTIVMKLPLGEDQYMKQSYTMYGDEYMLDYDVEFSGFNEIIPRNTRYINLNWVSKLQQQEKNISRERNRSGVIFKYANDEVDWLSERGSSSKDISSSIKWVSFKQQFFTQTLIADEPFDRGKVETSQGEDFSHVETDEASLTIPFEHNPYKEVGMRMYLGPNHYQTLKSYDQQLEEQLSLGWFIIGWINKLVIIPLFNLLDNFIPSYGVIIIILTVIIKLALSPLTYKSFMSQAKMRALKPEIDEVKEKHGNDQQKVQMEQMKLYRQAGINPMGGCFPMLLQLPFLVAMFHFYPASIELRQEAFLWANDLSTYDSIWNFPGGFSIPFYGDHVSLFTLLMASSTMLYSWYNQKITPTSNDQMGQQMKIMTYVMPFFILFIFNGYSAGLSCYYFFYNIFSFLQTYLFKQFISDDKIRAGIEEKKKKPAASKSKFQQRLEDMAKQQQEAKQSGKAANGKGKKKKK